MTRHAALTPDPGPRKDAGRPEGTDGITCECACDCCSEVARLREENAMLRAAAHAFGDLAERLNLRLQGGRTAAATSPNPPSRGNIVEVPLPGKERR